jgi:hypothetical protein
MSRARKKEQAARNQTAPRKAGKINVVALITEKFAKTRRRALVARN